MVGQKIRQYRVLERLGTGGMGSVYRAADDMLGREVALKIRATIMEESTARFRAEAAALARLSHSGIATVYELVEDDTRLVMAMELVRGRTLHEIIEQAGAFAPRAAAELCMQVLAALQHAHAAGVVHRDLKPGNLMITDGGSIKIVDFGIARLDGAVNLTIAGKMLGTPAYMAPEQVLGHPIDARVDLYAMGIVFFRLITAALPFKADTSFDMAQAQVQDAPAKASDLRTDLPPWVDDILTRALAKKPDERFQSATEFHEALARAIAVDAPNSAVAPSVEATEIMTRPVRMRAARRPPTVWLTATAAVVLATAVWILVAAIKSDPPVSAASALVETKPTGAPEVAGVQQQILDRVPSAQADLKVGLSVSGPAGPQAGRPRPNAAPILSTASSIALETPSAGPPPPPASFGDVKFLAIDGERTAASDVVVHFSNAEVSVQPPNGEAPAAVLPYQRITKATYAHGRDPKWDPALSAPTEKINVPGFLGRARHWLVLQSAESYLILRLDGGDPLKVMKVFEERSGIVVDRSGGKPRN